MAAITVTCPSCSTSFPVDPAKIPEGGVNARCSSCGDIFRIEKPDPVPSVADLAPTEPPAPEEPAGPPASEEAQAPPDTEEPETPPLATPPPLPDEPAKAEPVAEAPAPSAPDTPAPTPPEPETVPAPAETGFDDPFAQPAPFEEALEEDEEEEEVEPLPTLDDIETAETASEADEALPEPEPSKPLPPPSTAETLPAPEADDAVAAPSPQPSAPEPGEPAPAEEVAETTAPKVQGFTFGKRDPKDKAKRLARVLVSDMIMYNAERHQSALAQGTLQQDFEEEIEKSWKEFVEQVGEEMAEGEGRQYWTDALNDILAKGEKVF